MDECSSFWVSLGFVFGDALAASLKEGFYFSYTSAIDSQLITDI